MSERGQMRRRLREQRRVREGLLLDLGALVYELHRQGKRAPELLQQKAAELTVVDEEVRELQAALGGSEERAEETTEVEAVAGEEPEADGEREHDGELREDELGDGEPGGEGQLREDELDEGEPGGKGQLREDELGEGEPGGESELRRADEVDEDHERGDTAELGPEELAEEDEQLEGGDPEDGGREDEDSYDEPLVEREEPRA